MLDLLEIQSLNQRVELVYCLLQLVVHQSIGEQHWIVSHLNLFNCVLDPQFKLLFGLCSRPKPFPEVLKGWRVDKEEVSFNCLFVDFNCSLHVDLYDWDFAICLDSFEFSVSGAVKVSMNVAPLEELVPLYPLRKINHLGNTLIKSSLLMKW